jgi:predicted transcriptional regulator
MQQLHPVDPLKRIFPFFGAASGTQLGPLEQQLLEALWQRGNATVRELLDDEKVTQAYTTVMTTLDRLYKKKLLDRVSEGRAFRYSPRQSADELRRVAAVEGIRQLIGSAEVSSLPLSYLVEALSSHDAQLLDELQILVERKRKELRKAEQE